MAINDRLFSSTRKKRKIKDKKIQIYKESKTYDKYNTPIGKGLKVIHNNIWAYARQTSASEYYAIEDAISSQVYRTDMLFTINYRDDLDNEMVIRYKDGLYLINRIDYFEGYKEDILISARYLTDINDREYKKYII